MYTYISIRRPLYGVFNFDNFKAIYYTLDMKFKTGDIIVTLLLVTISFFTAYFSRQFDYSYKGEILIVELNGKVYGKYPLNQQKTFIVKSSNGGYNTIEIKNNSCSISQTNCPDHICMNMPKISMKGQSIVCLPHRLYIYIENDNNRSDDIDQVVR